MCSSRWQPRSAKPIPRSKLRRWSSFCCTSTSLACNRRRTGAHGCKRLPRRLKRLLISLSLNPKPCTRRMKARVSTSLSLNCRKPPCVRCARKTGWHRGSAQSSLGRCQCAWPSLSLPTVHSGVQSRVKSFLGRPALPSPRHKLRCAA